MRNQITRIATLSMMACATLLMPAAAEAAQDRVSATEKGSCLMFSKVEIRWDSTGALIQDTFIDITNDFGEDVRVQMYFINGDAPLDAGPGNTACGVSDERAHPGWNHVSVEIMLTKNQPTYWSAYSGQGGIGVAPFTVLDPAGAGGPGRPDPDGSCDRVLRGYIVAWAVDSNNEEIRWNHLKGDAILINYDRETAWEYNAWAFQVVSDAENGDPTGDADAGHLKMDGVEYAPGFDVLILDFYAEWSEPFLRGNTGMSPVVHTDLTTHPISVDLRQEDDGPITTKLKVDVWNEDEVKFNGLERCITCWDQVLLENFAGFGIPNNFLYTTLGTNKGKARINGIRSDNCDFDWDPVDGLPLGADPRDIVSSDASILGLAAKHLDFPGDDGYAAAGTNLIGAGTENGSVQYDALDAPPEVAGPEQGTNNGGVSVDGVDSALDVVRDGLRAARRN